MARQASIVAAFIAAATAGLLLEPSLWMAVFSVLSLTMSGVIMYARHQGLYREEHAEQYVQRGSARTRRLLGLARVGKHQGKPTDAGDLVKKSLDMNHAGHGGEGRPLKVSAR
ncbi:MAG TPA: hypothetical protein PLR71_14010 [Deltaproteobacteria bacterium]|nr:hypothetical protein [Deltaproteobacteria bacterium]